MAQLSVSQAWNETAGFLAREGKLIWPIALLLVTIPGIAAALVTPEPVAGMTMTRALPAFLATVVTAVLGLLAAIAISYLALRPGASVGEALRVSVRRFPPLLLASLMIGCAVALLLAAILLPTLGDVRYVTTLTPDQMPPGVATLLLLFIPLSLALWVRLMAMTPSAAVEPGGPIALIRRSVQLTRGHFWRLFGSILMLLVVATIVILAVSMAVGLILVVGGSSATPGTLGGLIAIIVSALMQTVVSVVLVVLVARIYAQLSGGAVASSAA